MKLIFNFEINLFFLPVLYMCIMNVSPFFLLSCLIFISSLTEILLLSPNSPFYLFWCVWSPEFEWGSKCGRICAGVRASECLDHWGKWHPFSQLPLLARSPSGRGAVLWAIFFQDEMLNGPILCRSCAGNTVAVNSQPCQPCVSAHHVHQVCFPRVLFNLWSLQSFISLLCDVLWA